MAAHAVRIEVAFCLSDVLLSVGEGRVAKNYSPFAFVGHPQRLRRDVEPVISVRRSECLQLIRAGAEQTESHPAIRGVCGTRKQPMVRARAVLLTHGSVHHEAHLGVDALVQVRRADAVVAADKGPGLFRQVEDIAGAAIVRGRRGEIGETQPRVQMTPGQSTAKVRVMPSPVKERDHATPG